MTKSLNLQKIRQPKVWPNNTHTMKIGDKVRFLNEVGGGIVAGFADNQTALVRDEDGFEIPVLIRECVVVDTDNYNIARQQSQPPIPNLAPEGPRPADNRFRTQQPDTYTHSFDDDEDDKPITFRPRPLERRGADVLNIYLGFVPMDTRNLQSTAFEAYLINDSNYYIHYALLTHEGATCSLRHEGTVEPNTKAFLEEFTRDVLPEWEKITFQTFAYKADKPFRPKEALSVTLRPDCTKFYKLHTFADTDFFEQPAYLLALVRDDQPARTVFASAEEIKEALLPKARASKSPARKATADKRKTSDVVEVDLHVNEILETTAGMSARDILDYQLKVFRETMEAHRNERGRRIVFIHGKGEGVLRNALIAELRRNYKHCTFQDASFREYGFGATMVKVGK